MNEGMDGSVHSSSASEVLARERQRRELGSL